MQLSFLHLLQHKISNSSKKHFISRTLTLMNKARGSILTKKARVKHLMQEIEVSLIILYLDIKCAIRQ
jgi:hypothetical protein